MTRQARLHHLALARLAGNPRNIPLKQWLAEQAARLHIAPNSVLARLHRHGFPGIQLKRINARVVFVNNAP